jgi:hypothetical protein
MPPAINVSTCHYPESDGKPIGETDEHRDEMIRHIEVLRQDTKDKPDLYARLGIREYFMFDPDHEYLDPPLQGYRLTSTGYVPIELDEEKRLFSEELELRLQSEGGLLQFFCRDTGQRLLTAEERARAESDARRAAEDEVQRLREELSRRGSRDSGNA